MRFPGFISLFFKSISQFFEIRKTDENESIFIKELPSFSYFSKIKKQKAEGYILVQAPKDYEFAIIYPLVGWILKKKYNANTGLWMMRSRVESIYHKSWHYQLLNQIRFNRYSDKKWSILFSVLGGKVIFSNASQFKNKALVNQLTTTIFDTLKSKEDVLKISLDGIAIGDLIYDFYLRMANKPTVDIKDPFLRYVIEQGIHNFYCADELFNKENIKCVVTTYTTYTHHGIIVRHALKRNITVYAFGNASEFVLQINKEFPSHSKNYTKYAADFELLKDQESKLLLAKESFEKRFSGQLDSALYYMRNTSFSKYDSSAEKIFKESPKKRVVIFLHCFFDSPHIYRDMLFPDFYEWLETTLRIASKTTSIDFYVKPHPNALPGNEEIVETFKKNYSSITFLEKSVSNNQLIGEGFAAAITVYGTLAHEYPYFGIPVLCAGDNPHAAFDFCYQPKTREEYCNLIENIEQLKVNENAKENILKFYYMHNLVKNSLIEKDIFEIRSYKGTGNDSMALVKFIAAYKDKQAHFKDKMNQIESNL